MLYSLLYVLTTSIKVINVKLVHLKIWSIEKLEFILRFNKSRS